MSVGVAGTAVLAVEWQDVSGHYFRHYFLLFFSPPFFTILRRDLFSETECSDQEIYLAKVDGSAQ